jgi:hypothetical protein
MSPESIKTMQERQPFIPFRIHVSDQSHYDITRPALVMIGGAITIVGIVRNVQSEFFDEPVIIANRHITRLEPLIEADAAK